MTLFPQFGEKIPQWNGSHFLVPNTLYQRKKEVCGWSPPIYRGDRSAQLRRRRKGTLQHLYKLYKGRKCCYCGTKSTGKEGDHVPPLVRSRREHKGWRIQVPCCQLCNTALGVFPGTDLRARRIRIWRKSRPQKRRRIEKFAREYPDWLDVLSLCTEQRQDRRPHWKGWNSSAEAKRAGQNIRQFRLLARHKASYDGINEALRIHRRFIETGSIYEPEWPIKTSHF